MLNHLFTVAWLLGLYQIYTNCTCLTVLLVILAIYFTFNILPYMFHLEPLRGEDSFFLFECPNNKFVASIILITQGRLSFKKFKHAISSTLKSDSRTQKHLVKLFGVYYWKQGQDYDENRHYILHKEKVTKADIQQTISKFAKTDMDFQHPLYEFHVYKNYEDGNSIVLFRFHHVFVDGLAVVSMLMKASDKGGVQEVYKGKSMPWYKSVPMGVVAGITSVFYLVASMAQKKNKGPLKSEKLSGIKQIDWSRKIDVKKVIRFCKANQCTMNDYLTAAILKSLFKYSGGHAGEISTGIPISMRGYTSDGSMLQLQNHLTMLPVTFTLGSKTILQDSRDVFNTLKSSPKPLAFAFLIRWLIPIVPFRVMKELTFFLSNKLTFLFSNAAGPREPLIFGGVPVDIVMGFTPNIASVGFSFTSVSYMNFIMVGCYADTVVVERPGDILKIVEETILEDLKEDIFISS